MKEYSLKLTQLSRYAPTMVADSRAKTRKFVSIVSEIVIKECLTTMIINEIVVTSLMVLSK